jgi:SPP1 gp7 family putative phage head morphogenesis protein
VRSTFDAVNELRPLMDDLRRALRGAKTRKQAERALDKWLKANKDNETLAELISGPAIQAELAGQLMVDVNDTRTVDMSRTDAGLWVFQDEAVPAFLDTPWREAIDIYETLDIPRKKEFERLAREYRSRGEEAYRLFLEQIRKRSLNAILEALEGGETFADFTADLDDFTDRLGVGRADPAYLETVFRTNIASAYGAGRQRALEDTKDELPYWQYFTVDDSRVRENHKPMHEKIFQHGNASTDALKPPNGFNCRCVAVMAEPTESDEVLTSPPPGGSADPGFNKSPLDLVAEEIG